MTVGGAEGVLAVWRHRHLLLRTALGDLRTRYAGSVLGIGWLVLYPLLLLGAYAAVRVGISGPDGRSTADVVLMVFCGLVPFLGFAEALAIGTSSVSGNSSLVKNTLFPIEMVPVKAVLVSQASQIVGTVILMFALAAWGKLTAYALFLPLVWFLQLMATIGVIWVLASLNVFVRDLQQVIGLLTLVLMLISPISYASDSPTAGTLWWIVLPNPVAHMIFCTQDCLILGRALQTPDLLFMVIFAVVAFVGGHWFFGRLKRVMTDNV